MLGLATVPRQTLVSDLVSNDGAVKGDVRSARVIQTASHALIAEKAANPIAVLVHVLSTAAFAAVHRGATHANEVILRVVFQVGRDLVDGPVAARFCLHGQSEKDGTNERTCGIIGSGVRVGVLELKLLHKRVQTDRVLPLPPVAGLHGYRLCVNIADDCLDIVNAEGKIFAVEMVSVMTNRVTKNYNGMIVELKTFHALDRLVREFAQKFPSVSKRNKTDLSKAITGRTP
jgi:hypothetical protein